MAGRKRTLNDDDRAEWVSNDEGLLSAQQRSGMGMRAYIRAHRAEIDAHIAAVLARPPATPGAF